MGGSPGWYQDSPGITTARMGRKLGAALRADKTTLPNSLQNNQPAPHYCPWPGCSAIAQYGVRYCPEHEAAYARGYAKTRPRERYYSSAHWARIRRTVLLTRKCAHCGGEAHEVHHIVPRSRGGADTAGNLIALCKGCHSRVTAEHRRKKLIKCANS